MKTITVTNNDAGLRADRYLSRKFPALTQGVISSGIRKNKIKLNGKKLLKSGVLITSGDVFNLYFDDNILNSAEVKTTKSENAIPKSKTLEIVYEDENIVVAFKPQGLLSQPVQNENDSFETRLKAMFGDEINLAHRIDRNTGGLLVAGKNALALRFLEDLIRNRELVKSYLLLVNGEILHENFKKASAFLFKDEKKARVFVTANPQKGAKEIAMYYRKIKNFGDNKTLCEARLITGRTHQLRAHFAYLGCPICGDGKYGKLQNNRIKMQALLSYKIRFDFQNSNTEFNYLNKKEITLDEKKITGFFSIYEF